MHKVKFYHIKIKPLSWTSRSKAHYRTSHLAHHTSISITHLQSFSSTSSTSCMRPTNFPPRLEKHLPHIITERTLSHFGAPIYVFCTNQTPLFYSFGKCRKTAKGALCPPPTHSFFLPWHKSLVTLGWSITLTPKSHYDIHNQFIPTLEVLPTPGLSPSKISYDCSQDAFYTPNLGH